MDRPSTSRQPKSTQPIVTRLNPFATPKFSILLVQLGQISLPFEMTILKRVLMMTG